MDYYELIGVKPGLFGHLGKRRVRKAHMVKVRELQMRLRSPYYEERERARKLLEFLRQAEVSPDKIMFLGEDGQQAEDRIVADSRRPLAKRAISFRQERLVLVLDNSGSMAEQDYLPSRIEAAQDAAKELVEKKIKIDPRDEVAVVGFSEYAKACIGLIRLEKGKQAIFKAIDSLRAEGWTAIGRGLRKTSEVFKKARKGEEDGQKGQGQRFLERIVLLSDGEHNTGPDPLPVARILKSQGVVIDTIGIGGSPQAVDEDVLKAIATTINGKPRYRFIKDSAELFEHFRSLADKIVKLD